MLGIGLDLTNAVLRPISGGAALPVISLSPASISHAEGASGSTAYVYTATRTGDLSGTSSASWAVTGSGANPAVAADFNGGTLPSGMINFAAGASTATITVSVAGDSTVEPDEGFTVTLSSPVNATIGTATATGTITNDDSAPTEQVDIIPLFGDSYTVGIYDREAGDTDWPNVYQFRSYTGDAGYRTIDSDTTPLSQQIAPVAGHSYLSPIEYMLKARQERTGHKIVVVPMGFNGSQLLGGSAIWPTTGTGYSALVAQVNAAVTAAASFFPGATINIGPIVGWLGTNDITAAAGNPTTYSRANFRSAMNAVIAGLRSSITGASSATKVLLGGMLPEIWAKNITTSGPIEWALRDVHRDGSNVYFAQSPTGWIDSGGTNLHPTLVANRAAGAAWDALLADTTPATISAPSTFAVYAGQKVRVELTADKYVAWTLSGANASEFEVVEEYFDKGIDFANALPLFTYVLRLVGDATASTTGTKSLTLNAKTGSNVTSTKGLTVSILPAYGTASAGAITHTLTQTATAFSNRTAGPTAPARYSLTMGQGLNLILLDNSITAVTAMKVNGVSATLIAGLSTDQRKVWSVPLAQAGPANVDLYATSSGNVNNCNMSVVTLTNTLASPTAVDNSGSIGPSTVGAGASMTISAGGTIIGTGLGRSGDTISAPGAFLMTPDGSRFWGCRDSSGTIQLNGAGQTRQIISLAFDKAP